MYLSLPIVDYSELYIYSFSCQKLSNTLRIQVVLASIANTIAKLGINIIHAIVHTDLKDPSVSYILLYLDLEGVSDEKGLLRELSENKAIYDVKTARTIIDGFISDIFHFPLTIGDTRVVIMALPVLEGLITITQKYESLKAPLWYQGYEAGVETAKFYRKYYNAKKPDEILSVLKARYLALGWSRLKILYMDEAEGKFVLRLYNNRECEIIRN